MSRGLGRREGDVWRRDPVGGAPAFTPLMYSPIFWLRDSYTLAATKIASWTDLSGNGNHFVQAVDASRPTYNAANTNLGNQPTADFAGGQTMTCSITGGYANVTVCYCYRPVTAIVARPMITSGGAAGSLYAAGDAIALYGAAGFDQLNFTSADLVNTKYRKALRFPFGTVATSAPDAFRDGAAQGGTMSSNTATNGTLSTVTWTLGTTVLAAVGEIIVFPSFLDASQIANVNAYQLARFAA